MQQYKDIAFDEECFAPGTAPNRVRSFAETAEIIGTSISTLRRLVARGDGPKVTHLSPRREGIQDRHREEWLLSRSSTSTARDSAS